MTDYYEQLGLVESQIYLIEIELEKLYERKKFLNQIIKEEYDRSLYPESGRNQSTDRKQETDSILDESADTLE